MQVRFCSSVFLFVPWISWKWLNRFAPNLQGRRVWSLARTSFNVKVKGQMSRSSGTKTKLLKLLSHAAPDGTNILGIAEGICAKFTEKMCLAPCSDEFECEGQRSNVKVIRDKNGIFGPFGGLRACS